MLTIEECKLQGLGLAIGATLMDIKKATTLASVTVMTFMLAGGFFVKVRILIPLTYMFNTPNIFFDFLTFRSRIKTLLD